MFAAVLMALPAPPAAAPATAFPVLSWLTLQRLAVQRLGLRRLRLAAWRLYCLSSRLSLVGRLRLRAGLLLARLLTAFAALTLGPAFAALLTTAPPTRFTLPSLLSGRGFDSRTRLLRMPLAPRPFARRGLALFGPRAGGLTATARCGPCGRCTFGLRGLG